MTVTAYDLVSTPYKKASSSMLFIFLWDYILSALHVQVTNVQVHTYMILLIFNEKQDRLGIGPYWKSNVKLGKAKEAIATPKASAHSVSYTRSSHFLFKLGLSHWLYHRLFSVSSCPKPESSESRNCFVGNWNRQVQLLPTSATRLHWKARVSFMINSSHGEK